MRADTRFKVVRLPVLAPLGTAVLFSAVMIPALGFLGSLTLLLQLLMLAAWLMAFMALLVYDYLRASAFLSSLEIEAEVPPVLYSGVASAIPFTIRSASGADGVSLWLRPPPLIEIEVEQHIRQVSFEPGRKVLRFDYKLVPVRRGVLEWEKCYGRILLARRLAAWQFVFRFGSPIQSKIYANPGVHAEPGKAMQQCFSGERVVEVAGSYGQEFDSLRRYQLGDDQRKIDWKRSARCASLLVRVYRPETHQRINIAIDCGRCMNSRVENRLQLEYAADAAAHLAHIAHRNEDEVGLFAFSGQVLTSIAPRRGAQQVRRINEVLMRLEAAGLEADYQLLSEWAGMNRRRSLLILVTGASSPASFEQIRVALMPARRRHAVLVVAAADRDLQSLSLEPAANLEDAYMVAAAAEQLTNIRNSVQLMHRSGIECAYCDASELPQVLRAHYVRMKVSGRWK